MIPQFLHPFLLWGAFAAAVPVVIHLIHRRRFRRQRWAAMEWLLAAARQNQRRMQLENLLLLVVRTLAVLLLALAIARPTFSDVPLLMGQTRRTHLYVLLDNSGSTAARSGTRTTLDDGLAAVANLVSGLGEDDPVTLFVTNDNWGETRGTGRPRRLLKAQTSHGAVRQRLGELKPAAARADVAEALRMLEEEVASSDSARRQVAIVTDLQEASFPPRNDRGGADDAVRTTLLRLREKGAEVVLLPVGRPDAANVAVTALRTADDRDVVQGSSAIFQAEIRNYSDLPQKVEVRFSVDGAERGDSAQWVNLPARNAGPDAPPAMTAQYHTVFRPEDVGVHVVEARIRTDALAYDDVRGFAFRVRPRIRVLAVDPGVPSGDPGARRQTYWLKLSLAPRDEGPFHVTQATESEFHALRELGDWDVVVLADVERPAIDDEGRRRLEEFVSRGGALFLSVGEHVVAARWNADLGARGGGQALLPARLGEPRVAPDAKIRLDLKESRHPLLRNINDPQFASFFDSPVLFGRMTVEGVEGEKETRVALAYDDLAHSPAFLERRFGQGRVLLYTSTLDNAWGRFAGSYVYPALLHEAAYWLTTRGDAERNLTAFQPWVRARPDDLASVEVHGPDGATVPADPAVDATTLTVLDTAQLGVYRALLRFRAKDLLGAAPPAEPDAFAVNLSPLESDLRRLDESEVRAAYRDLLSTGADSDARADSAKARAGEIAAPLLAAALACLLLEVFLVQRIGRGRRR